MVLLSSVSVSMTEEEKEPLFDGLQQNYCKYLYLVT